MLGGMSLGARLLRIGKLPFLLPHILVPLCGFISLTLPTQETELLVFQNQKVNFLSRAPECFPIAEFVMDRDSHITELLGWIGTQEFRIVATSLF